MVISKNLISMYFLSFSFSLSLVDVYSSCAPTKAVCEAHDQGLCLTQSRIELHRWEQLQGSKERVSEN